MKKFILISIALLMGASLTKLLVSFFWNNHIATTIDKLSTVQLNHLILYKYYSLSLISVLITIVFFVVLKKYLKIKVIYQIILIVVYFLLNVLVSRAFF